MKNGPPAVLVRGPARTYKSGRMRNRDRLKSMAASPARPAHGKAGFLQQLRTQVM
jgi:hypothetical protein